MNYQSVLLRSALSQKISPVAHCDRTYLHTTPFFKILPPYQVSKQLRILKIYAQSFASRGSVDKKDGLRIKLEK